MKLICKVCGNGFLQWVNHEDVQDLDSDLECNYCAHIYHGMQGFIDFKQDESEPKKPAGSERLISRLQNWKFASAIDHLVGQPQHVIYTVTALATSFGNCGWALEGSLGIIVEYAVDNLIEEISK